MKLCKGEVSCTNEGAAPGGGKKSGGGDKRFPVKEHLLGSSRKRKSRENTRRTRFVGKLELESPYQRVSLGKMRRPRSIQIFGRSQDGGRNHAFEEGEAPSRG